MEKQGKIISSAFSIGTGTLISRILGLFREIGMAALFGTSMVADVFVAAFRIPNLLRRLFAEGAFYAAFIPKYTEKLTQKSKDDALEFASASWWMLLFILILVTLIGILIAPWLVSVFTYGWRGDPQKMALTIKLTQVLFPYIIFMGLGAVLSGILNSHHRFFLPAVSPALLNVFWIGAILIAMFAFDTSPQNRVIVVVIGVLLGGIGQAFIQLPATVKLGFKMRFAIARKAHDLMETGKLMVPGMFGLAVAEVNYIADLILASLLVEGSVAALQYGMRLVLLPLSILGISIATATLPTLSESAARKNYTEMAEIFSHTLRMMFTVLIPMAVLMLVLRTPIIKLLFERGSFSAAKSTPMTAWALLFYCLGLPAFGGIKGTVQAFYSMKDTRTPVKIAAYAMLLNVFFNVVLMGPLKHGGLALATSIASTFNLVTLLIILKKKLPQLQFRPILINLLKLFTCSGLMGIFAWILFKMLNSLWNGSGLPYKILLFLIPFVLGSILFAGLAYLFKIDELVDVWVVLKAKFLQRRNSRLSRKHNIPLK
ncbi:murein biosynthesis integral membrane protein MurJ [bacterium]|nr:murein biosynthesis integral membrane protein MurJ [bacterium]